MWPGVRREAESRGNLDSLESLAEDFQWGWLDPYRELHPFTVYTQDLPSIHSTVV